MSWRREAEAAGGKRKVKIRDKDSTKKCEREGTPTTPPSTVEAERNEILVLRLGYESNRGDKAPG